MSRVHGAFNVATGLWPVLHLRSFEAVLGPKVDRWLVYTVAGLAVSIGATQWKAGTATDWPHARRLGVATSGTLLLIDVINVRRGRISRTYLIDAAAEAVLIAGWAAASRSQAQQHQLPV